MDLEFISWVYPKQISSVVPYHDDGHVNILICHIQ